MCAAVTCSTPLMAWDTRQRWRRRRARWTCWRNTRCAWLSLDRVTDLLCSRRLQAKAASWRRLFLISSAFTIPNLLLLVVFVRTKGAASGRVHTHCGGHTLRTGTENFLDRSTIPGVTVAAIVSFFLTLPVQVSGCLASGHMLLHGWLVLRVRRSLVWRTVSTCRHGRPCVTARPTWTF